jgi:glycosyltransferase involved in cell wall biosynthesis
LWIRPSRIVTIPNGVRAPTVGESTLRTELGLASTDQLVVAVGNLYPVKGHQHLLDALAQLGTRHPALHVAIAGRGQLEDSLRRRAQELQLNRRFHLLGLRSDIGNVLGAADIFALPSLSEGVPLALLEAMLAGRPIVASAVGEIPIVLDGGRAGLLVPAADAPALANALSTLLSNPALARRVAGAGYARAAERYTLDAMLDAYLALYEQALGDQADDTRTDGIRDGERQALPHERPPGKRAFVR